MSDDFGYLNARIRARRGRMLPEGFFHEALDLSFAEMVKVLGESIYGADLTGRELGDVDRAVAAHLNHTVNDLPRLVSGQAREAVHLMLMRADLANVKTIVRGKAAGWPAEEIVGHLGAGTLSQTLYEVMSQTPDNAALAQVITLIGHPLAAAMRAAAAEGQDAPAWEAALDHTFFASLLLRARQLDQPYLEAFIRLEIDALNLAAAYKLSLVEFEGQPDRYFLAGGRIVGPALLKRLAQGEVAALEELGGSAFKPASEARDLAGLERALRCILLAKAREGRKDALGAGLAIDYIQCKQWEAARVRLLARRSFYGLPREFAQREVLCP